jgi:hypothetical protein
MYMKTKDNDKSLVAQTAGSAVCGFSMVAGSVIPLEVSDVWEETLKIVETS